jgi:acetyltransferase-like isoleucine patch superfamily enzyme
MYGILSRTKSIFKHLLLGRLALVPDPYHHPQVKIGRHSYGLTPFTIRIYTENDRVMIGCFCSIAKNVKIVAGGERYPERVSNYSLATYLLARTEINKDVFTRGQVVIGHDVWIGTGAIILPGASIGNGAVIAAGSVVRGAVDNYAIVGGVPSRLIRYRFKEEQRQQLLKIAWWEWPDELIIERLDHFYGSVDEFIKLYGGKNRDTE